MSHWHWSSGLQGRQSEAVMSVGRRNVVKFREGQDLQPRLLTGVLIRGRGAVVAGAVVVALLIYDYQFIGQNLNRSSHKPGC